MPLIQTTDAQGLFTKAVTAAYKERISPKGGMRAIFTEKVVPTLEVSIAVQRTKEKIAKEVPRGTDGNRNEFSRTSEKIFLPLYFREWFDLTKLQLYNALFSSQSIDSAIFAAFVDDVTHHIMICQEKIERSIEKMGADVLTTGKVYDKDGNVYIDYGRKAESFTDAGAGNYFANAGIDPFKQLKDDCDFLRKVGKAEGGVFNAWCGETAINDLIANDVFQKRQNLFHMSLDQVQGPVRDAVGTVFHGIITCGPYKVQLWSYPDYYENAAGSMTSYLDAKKITLTPLAPKFQTVYGAVPQLLEPGQTPQIGKFIFGDYVEKRSKSRVMDVESCPLCVPIAVDQMVTRKVVA